ncbi:hypothetical protein E1262_23520, partial [Jiangella aurantiaca]
MSRRSDEEGSEMAVCGSCGNRVSELARECARCRAPIAASPAPVAAAVPPPPSGRVTAPPPAPRPGTQPIDVAPFS